MALLRRQSFTYKTFDDQGPELWGSYAGDWTHYLQNSAYNSTVTVTSTPGASLSFTFSGSQAFVQGCFLSGDPLSGCVSQNGSLPSTYPTADYLVDGISSIFEQPYLNPSGGLIYFSTPILKAGTHTINVKVTNANLTNYYALDRIEVAIDTTSGASSTPNATATHSTSVAAIVGGVVGGIAAIAALAFAVFSILCGRCRGR
ncbi:hypothetical protein BJ322DRAFT_284118 [Thelephora terrestris]|uniref:Uncharacterized protein n=1 Tax=Thelephora terrestris TaxID=56493 RepID=A0A9P6H8I9_9AGAM|nr:hypothetical protein BJ322DRAFT_284118 [Thelephora terrestris]